MTTNVAPYNFVPLSPYVYFPPWADEVSQDVPFRNGICGWLTLEIVAETPILVGGETERRGNGPDHKRFVRIAGKPAIPGSSIKGMLRAVIEIASYGKLQRFNPHRFSIRDLNDAANYRRHMTQRVAPGVYRSQVKAGWLRIEGSGKSERWTLAPCEYGRVDFDDLVEYSNGTVTKEALKARQGSKAKYELWKNAGLSLALKASVQKEADIRHAGKALRYRRVADLGDGDTAGRLVFTGQPGPSKHMDFFFADEEGPRIELPPKLREQFQFIHRSGQEQHRREYRGNEEYELLQRFVREEGRAPVFYLEGDPDRTPKALGLAMMFRLPCDYSVFDVVERQAPLHVDETTPPDLAELIFGHARSESSLRGRVAAEPAPLVTQELDAPEATTIPGAPKATHVPNYLVQPLQMDDRERVLWETYQSPTAMVRGWKRYPVRGTTQQQALPKSATDKVKVVLHPLAEGSKFETRVVFHNLRPEELGALLWAIDFGGKEECRHSLGSGRPLGYGQVRLKVLDTKLIPNDLVSAAESIDHYRGKFEELMEDDQPGWADGEVITHLCAMANPTLASAPRWSERLRYQTLEPNEFRSDKREGKRLEPYVDFNGEKDDQRLADRYGKLKQDLASRSEARARLALEKERREQEAREAERRAAMTSEQKCQERIAALLDADAERSAQLAALLDKLHEQEDFEDYVPLLLAAYKDVVERWTVKRNKGKAKKTVLQRLGWLKQGTVLKTV